MKIIGLSGALASGKNFTAEFFAQKGAAIFDADKEVHEILTVDKALIAKVAKAFPQSVTKSVAKGSGQKIERKILGKIVFADAKKLQILEDIIHPIIRKKYLEFLAKSRQEKKKIAVLNIPLLLEKQGYECDKVIALVVQPKVQKNRYFARHKDQPKKELEEKFSKITRLQFTNQQRKEKADFIVNTSFSKARTTMQLQKNIQ